MKVSIKKYIILIISFYVLWLFFLPYTFNKLLPIICNNLSHNTNYKINVQNPKLKLYIIPIATLQVDSVKIEQKNTNNFIYFNNLKTTFRILPLLSRKFHINSFDAQDFVINSSIDKKLIINKELISKLKNSKINLNQLNINNSKIIITNLVNKKPIILETKDLYYFSTSKKLCLKFKNYLNINNNNSLLNVNLLINKNNRNSNNIVDIEALNINLATYYQYFSPYISHKITNATGLIDLKIKNNSFNAILNDCKIHMLNSVESIIFPKKLLINSNFVLTSKKINFDFIEIVSSNINAKLTGYITHYIDSALSQINFNVMLNKSKLEDIISFLPSIKIEEINVNKLKEHKFQGEIMGNFNLSGNLHQPSLWGDILINNAVIRASQIYKKGATIKLDFVGKTMNYDVVIPVINSEKVWVKGDVELYNIKYANMQVFSTSKVDLKTAKKIIEPLHEILNFDIGPLPILNLNGTGQINLTIKGNRKNPHIWGKIHFMNLNSSLLDMPNLELKNANAILNFNDKNVDIIVENGLVNNQKIKLTGNYKLLDNYNLEILLPNQNLYFLYKNLLNSKLANDYIKNLPKISYAQGLVDVKLNVNGLAKDFSNLILDNNIFINGTIKFLENNINILDVNLNKFSGTIDFKGSDFNVNLSSLIGSSNLKIQGFVKNNIANLNIDIPKMNIKDLIATSNDTKDEYTNIYFSLQGFYNGNIQKIELNKLNLILKVLDTDKQNKIQLTNGEATVKNNKLKIHNLKGYINEKTSNFNINLNVDNISTKPNLNGKIDINSLDLRNMNDLFILISQINPEFKRFVDIIKFEKGNLNFNCYISNNKLNTKLNLNGIIIKYLPLNIPIYILDGNLTILKNTLFINQINLLADKMPIFINGNIQDSFSKNQKFNIYINTKPQQDFIDKYINKNQLYPIKIKGDIIASTTLQGTKENYNLKSELNLSKESSVYYLGATVGDNENAIVLNLDTRILHKNLLKIKEFSYDKLISAQSGKQNRLNMLKAKGGIEVFKEDLDFNNLHIKTNNPTDARIFNIIFRKPNIKQGQFISDLKFNGKLSNPRLLGSFHIFETNIPFLDTIMKNISFLFKDKTIELYSIGEVLGNDITFKGILKNKLIPPYYVESAELHTKILDLNHITNKLKQSQLEISEPFDSLVNFDIKNVIIKNIKTSADTIYIRNLVAENFKAQSSITENHLFNIENFKLTMANGTLEGDFRFNFNNYKTGLNLKANDINANELAIALFNLKDHIFGDLTGDVKLTCDGENFEKCLQTLNGNTTFNVINGRIPRLGSLEYLLKASNLIKGGFTGVSINSIIDLITPMKTGEFSSIYGISEIKKGVAEKIEIATQGKELSLFISGTYEFKNSNADMIVLGILSKKISTMFGPIGNVSINTLFNIIPGVDLNKESKLTEQINKIPGIELSNKAYRKFIALIKGDINMDNYVASFKWIN